MIKLFAFVLPGLLVVAGCGGGDEPASCKAVGEKAVALIQTELSMGKRPEVIPEGTDLTTAGAVTALLGPLKEGIVKKCEAGNWPPGVRDCVASATTLAAADACIARPGSNQASGDSP